MNYSTESYLNDSALLTKRVAKLIFGDEVMDGGFYQLTAGLILCQASKRATEYLLAYSDKENNLKMLDTLFALTACNESDDALEVRINDRKARWFDIADYRIPQGLGIDKIVNTSDNIYMNEMSKQKNIKAFERQLVSIDKIREGVISNSDVYDIMTPTQLENWFISLKSGDNAYDLKFIHVDKPQVTIDEYGCVNDHAMCDMYYTNDSIEGINDKLVKALGIVHKDVHYTEYLAKFAGPEADEVVNYLKAYDLATGDKNSTPLDKANTKKLEQSITTKSQEEAEQAEEGLEQGK